MRSPLYSEDDHPADLYTELTRSRTQHTQPRFLHCLHERERASLPCEKLCASGTTRSFPVPRGPTGLLGPPLDKLSVCLIVSTKWPSPTFPTLLASAILCMHCNLHCNCIRCRFFDQGMRNLHALQHLQLQDLQIGLQLCAICLQIWLAHVHACFSCQYFANLHCNCIRCRFSDQGMRNLHALQHLQDLQIGLHLNLCASCFIAFDAIANFACACACMRAAAYICACSSLFACFIITNELQFLCKILLACFANLQNWLADAQYSQCT